MQSIAAIVFVMGVLGAVLVLLRRRGLAQFRLPGLTRTTVARQLELVERIALGPQHALHLVRIGGRSVLIATAPGHCHILEGTPENTPESL